MNARLRRPVAQGSLALLLSLPILAGPARADRGELQLVREIEDHRLLGDARLRALLHSGDPAVAAAAAVAVGRIGDPSLEKDVIALLGSRHAPVRAAAALGLELLPGAAAEGALSARLLVERDAEVRAQLLLSLGHAGGAASVATVAGRITAAASETEDAAAAEALATLLRAGQAPAADPAVAARLLQLAARPPAERATAAAFALAAAAAKGAALPEDGLLRAHRSAAAASARAFLGRALAAVKSDAAVQALAASVGSDPVARVRADACRFLATTGASAPVLAALGAALHDPDDQVVAAAAAALGTLGSDAAGQLDPLLVAFDGASSPWVRSTVLTTLLGLDPVAARPRVLAGLGEAWAVRLAAINGLATLASAPDVQLLVDLAQQGDVRTAAAAIEAMTTLPASSVTPQLKAALRSALQGRDWEIVSSVADVAVAFGWSDFAADLGALYDAFPTQEALGGRIEILYALGNIGSTADLPLLQRGLADDEVIVEQTAAAAWQQLTGTDVSAQVRADSVVHAKTPPAHQVERALRSLVLLETSRGNVLLRMLPEAPLSATNFVALVERGFYDGLTFHRVVPNFVAQGGDPRGDGSGGSADLVREEISRVPHRRGTVGMATLGKDTGSSQFFFNLGWNVNLDGRYTVFAEVVDLPLLGGMEVVDRLEVGDVIRSARVIR